MNSTFAAQVAILNVGDGDTKLSFDKGNPVERARAAKIVTDMIRRGYALMIQVGEENGEPVYRRAHAFDADTCEYVILGGPDDKVAIGAETVAAAGDVSKERTRKKRDVEKRYPAESTRAVSVGRSAGG